MIDITSVTDGDLRVMETQVPKAANLLQVQLGDLEYAPDFGIDLAFFLDPEFQFQNESFKAYLVQRLSENHVNVNRVIDALSQFFRTYTFVVDAPESSGGGFIK